MRANQSKSERSKRSSTLSSISQRFNSDCLFPRVVVS
nr:MAG TPA: hypothetical protein [Caudoviricetes sp.]